MAVLAWFHLLEVDWMKIGLIAGVFPDLIVVGQVLVNVTVALLNRFEVHMKANLDESLAQTLRTDHEQASVRP